MDQKRIGELEHRINIDYGNTTGVVVLKEGKLVYEKYFNGCTRESQIHVYSVTKSIISILIGIAIDKGYIQSVDRKVMDFFPEYMVRKKINTIQNITIKDMLTMTAPYKYHLFAPYVKYFTSEDWVKFSLDLLGGRGKIGKFQYAPLIGPDIFSGILVKTTGQSVFEFADKNLFSPLEIHIEGDLIFKSKEDQLAFNESTDISGWVRDSFGIHTAGWGLTLSPMDMAKIGELYLNKGLWGGKRIISEKWVEESTREQSRWKKYDLPYGYLWWVNEDGYAAMGDGGNIIYVNTKDKMVVSSAALFVPKAKDRIVLIKTYIEPIFR